jgi:hypothetical protein
MKIVVCLLLTSILQVKSQDSLSTDSIYNLPIGNARPFEFGYYFFTVNSNTALLYTPPSYTGFEFLNGVLARYKYQKLSLRFHASYSSKKTSQYYLINSIQNWGEATTKDYKIGSGLQYSFQKKHDYLYVIMDLSYHKRATTATINNSQSLYQINLVSKLNGFDITPAIGSKLKLFKNLYATLETGYNYTYLAGKNNYSSYDFKSPESIRKTSVYTNLFTKFYLSLTF